MKLNKADKFVKKQFENGLTRNGVREAIFHKLGTWNFPPEYENALATQDPNFDRDNEPLLGVDYLDDYICDACGNCHELCFCGEDADEPWKSLGHSAEAERVIAKSQIHTMPEPGTQAFENMVDYMRADMASNMGYTKIEMAGRKIVEESIRCNDCDKVTHQDENSTGYCEHCGSANVRQRDFNEELARFQKENR